MSTAKGYSMSTAKCLKCPWKVHLGKNRCCDLRLKDKQTKNKQRNKETNKPFSKDDDRSSMQLSIESTMSIL